jgi:hypothetical protein
MTVKPKSIGKASTAPRRAADAWLTTGILGFVSNLRKGSAFFVPCNHKDPAERIMAKALLAVIGISFALLVAAFVYAAFTL